MDKENLIKIIGRKDVWSSAKHIYASILLDKFDSEEVRSFLYDKFVDTGDYYYCSILKLTK
mgnify:CR=1 FL=1